MMEKLSGFPGDVVAIRASGRVTGADYETVLIPAVEQAVKAHDHVRVYYEIGADFEGFSPDAMWDDFRSGMKHLTRWGRVALVTDVDWLAHMTAMFAFLMPAGARAFPLAQADAARAWLLEKA